MNKEDMRFQPRSTGLQFESCMKTITMYVMCAQVMRCYRNRCSLLILVIVIKFVLLMITSGYKRKGEGNREKRTCPKCNSSYKKCWGELHIYKGHQNNLNTRLKEKVMRLLFNPLLNFIRLPTVSPCLWRLKFAMSSLLK